MDEKTSIDELLDRVMRKPEKARETLIAEYGTVRGALDMDYRELIRSLPNEEIAVTLLSLLKYMARRTKLEPFGAHPFLSGLARAREYVQAQYIGSFYERCCLLCLDARFRLIRCTDLSSGSTLETPFYLRMVAEEIIRTNAVYLILAHNHPSGLLQFSLADLEVTSRCMQCVTTFRAVLLDHILYAAGNSLSLRSLGLFQDDKWEQGDPKPASARRWLSR